MDIDEYMKKAIEKIKSGQMTDPEWKEIGEAILTASEAGEIPVFDKSILPPGVYAEDYSHSDNCQCDGCLDHKCQADRFCPGAD